MVDKNILFCAFLDYIDTGIKGRKHCENSLPSEFSLKNDCSVLPLFGITVFTKCAKVVPSISATVLATGGMKMW